MSVSESKENLIEECLESFSPVTKDVILVDPTNRALGPVEKSFLLLAERGDCAGVRRLIHEYKDNPEELDINCVDPLNRSALIAAIENENIELVKLLIDEGIQVKDALLHAIKEEYIEGVEVLLNYEEEHHKPGQSYSWEEMDKAAATFTPDITPLILAAHKNNYEILKILLDRGASLPMPHDIRCACDDCVDSIKTDSLRHSRARINAYKALTASSLISLSSKDPVLTAFELSWELRRLSRMETEFREQYNEMRSNIQLFAMSLLDYVRSSRELEYMLNYDPTGDPWEPGDHQSLERLKLAIKYKQKLFVAHPSVQQLLASIWYEGLPGFRRKGLSGQLVQVAKLGIMFPVYCTIYMLAPTSKMGLFMKKPFVKFICHSTSYAFFLMLLGAASQRIEMVLFEWFAKGLGSDYVQEMVREWKRKERGAGPGFVECGVIVYVASLVWGEMKTLWEGGILDYISDLWNIVDFVTNVFYVMWISLRMSSVYVVWREASEGRDPWYPREQWDTFDPMLLSEGAFAAGMIFSFLKLVHIFSVNPHLGPLQISLGRMIIDIVKFFFIYTLVLFAFGCGLNQLLWYYAELEKNKCYHLPSGLPDFDNNDKACTIWRRYANLFEASQSLFWASFGLVDLVSFELTGIKGFTRFWALLMFGSYSVINVIVLLNMLIAMMSNSYQIISERSDSEWKFARTRLWMSYFDDGDTLPPPFNLFPTAKNISKTLGCRKRHTKSIRSKNRSREKARENHENVMRLLVRRYITAEQSKRDAFGVTEDDITEVRQDISTLRYELIEILHQNGMKTPKLSKEDLLCSGKKEKELERRLQKDFHIGIVEGIVCDIISSMKEPTDVFSQIARVMGKTRSVKRDWNALVKRNVTQDQIGSSQEAEAMQKSRQSLRRHIVSNVREKLTLDPEKLLEYNPKLSEVPPQARVAYAKFMTKKIEQDIKTVDEEDEQIRIRAQPPRKISVTFEGADQPSAAEGTSGTQETDAESKTVLDKSREKAAQVIAADDSFKALNNRGDEKRPLSPIIGSPTMSDRCDENKKVVEDTIHEEEEEEVTKSTSTSPPRRSSVTSIKKPPAPPPPTISKPASPVKYQLQTSDEDVTKELKLDILIPTDVEDKHPPEAPQETDKDSSSQIDLSKEKEASSEECIEKDLPSTSSTSKEVEGKDSSTVKEDEDSSPVAEVSEDKTSEDKDTEVESTPSTIEKADEDKSQGISGDSLTVTAAVVIPRGVGAGKSKLSGRMRTGWL